MHRYPCDHDDALFAWKYRESNTSAEYLPNWDHSTKIEFFVWGIPAVVIVILGAIAIWTSYTLDPYRPLHSAEAAGRKPLNVEVVALDWKWLFIYPDQVSLRSTSLPCR